MKALVVLLALLTATLLSGVGAATVRISTYSATGKLDIPRDPFTLGTRVLLTCDVTGLPEGSEVVSYRWFHSLTGDSQDRHQIRDRDPYYRVVKDTLLVDFISQDQKGKYTCFVSFNNAPPSGSIAIITVAGNPNPFLYTPTSLLPEHSVLTDVQQATGRNGQQWIRCRSGGQWTRPKIWMGSELVVNSSTANSATMWLITQRPNGLYHCLSAQSQREYFSLYLRNSATLPTPTASVWNNSRWSFTSPDGSRVDRYIVEFECRVRDITFVEKYTSVSASGGTGRVATSPSCVSCFGGQGQLYRVKVWAVNGPNISPALNCTPDGQCSEKGGRRSPTTTTSVSKGPTTLGNTDSSTTPAGPQASSTAHSDVQHEGTFIGVGVGVGVFLLLVLSTVVVVILVVVIVKRKAARKQKMYNITRASLWYHNSVVVEHEEEKKETVAVSADYDEGDGYQDVDIDKGEDDNPLYGFITDEVINRRQNIKNTKTPAPMDSPTPASVPAVYAVANEKKKRGAKKTENGFTVANRDPRDVMLMKKMATMTVKEEGVVVSGGVEEEEKRDDMVEFRYEPKAES